MSNTPDRLRESAIRAWTRAPTVLAGLLIGLVGLWYVATLRDGHDWGDDFAQYLLHAQAIAEGHPYGDIGYLYNPANPIAPPTYPPVFPAMLAPVVRAVGLDLSAAKLVGIASFLAALALLFAWARRRLPTAYALGLIALLGFNPQCWLLKDQVLSDFPFLLWWAAILLVATPASDPSSPRYPWRRGLGLGMLCYLAYGTRSVGLVIPLSLVVSDLCSHRRLQRTTVVSLVVFSALALLQQLLLHSDQTYAAQFGQPLRMAWSHAVYYSKELRDLWRNDYGGIPMRALFLLVNGLAAIGYASRLRRGLTIAEVFPIFYLAMLLSWPHYQGVRLLLPLLPCYLLYALTGLHDLTKHDPVIARWGLGGFVALALATYAARYTRLSFGPIDDGVQAHEAAELVRYITDQTPADAVWITAKPRALALLTRRPAGAYSLAGSRAEQWEDLCRMHARYAVVSPLFYTDQVVAALLEERAADARQVFANGRFTAYQLSCATAAGRGDTPRSPTAR